MRVRLLKTIRKRFEILRVDKVDSVELSTVDRIAAKRYKMPFVVLYDNDWHTKYFVQTIEDAKLLLMDAVKEIYTHDRKVGGLKTTKLWY